MDISMDVFIKIKVSTLLQHSYFKTFNRLFFLMDFWEKLGKRSGIYTEMRTLMGVLIEAVKSVLCFQRVKSRELKFNLRTELRNTVTLHRNLITNLFYHVFKE